MSTLKEYVNYIGDIELIVVGISIIICNMIGILVLLATVFKGVWHYFHRELHVRLLVAQGIALALEFKLAGEVLRMVIVRDWSELVIIGTITALRGAISLLIHWEIKSERMDQEREMALEKAASIQNDVQ